MRIKYGMKVLVGMTELQYLGLIGNIAITADGDEEKMVECSVERYWPDDKEPTYKVKLVPTDDENKYLYGTKNMYVMDLETSINMGQIKII